MNFTIIMLPITYRLYMTLGGEFWLDQGFESVPSNIGPNINHTRCFSFSDQIDLI